MQSQDDHPDDALSPAYADKHSVFICPIYQDISQIDEDFQKDHWARMVYENDPYGSLDMLMFDADSQPGPSTSSISPMAREHNHDDDDANDKKPHGTLHPKMARNGGDQSERGHDTEMREPDGATQCASPLSLNHEQNSRLEGFSDTDSPPQPFSPHISSPEKERSPVSKSTSTRPGIPPNRSCTHDAPASLSPGPEDESPSRPAGNNVLLQDDRFCNPRSRQADNPSRLLDTRGLNAINSSQQSHTKPTTSEAGFDIQSAPRRTLTDIVSPLSGILGSFLGSRRPPKEAAKKPGGSSRTAQGIDLLPTSSQQPEIIPGRGPLQRAFQQPPAPPTTRQFRMYAGDKQNPSSSHTIQLSSPGRLEDFNHIPEGDLKAIRDSPENATWHSEVSRLFWSRVMEYNTDIIPSDAAFQKSVLSLLCRSNILIEDLWTAHQVYKSMALPIHWKANGEPSLLRLKHWMTREGDNSTWRATLASKESEYERLVPWVPRERLIVLCILLRKGHPGDIVRVDLNGEPLAHRKVKQSKTMARKKHALIADCHLLYQCQDAAAHPPPSSYWAGFQEALDAGQVRLWDETTAAAYRAEDEEARWAYDAEDRSARRGPSRGPSVPPPPASVGGLVPDQRWPALFRDAKGPAMMAAAAPDGGDARGEQQRHVDHGRGLRDLRLQQLEREVAQLRAYVRNMYEHLAAQLKDFPAPPPWV